MKTWDAIRSWIDHPVVTPGMIKIVVVSVGALAIVVPLALVAVPYIEFFNDMAVQYKVKAQMAWKVVGGIASPADFPPVDGTLPQGVHPYPFPVRRVADPEASKRLEAENAVAAEQALEAQGPGIAPPYRRPKPTLADVQRGQKMFNTHCIVCHGKYGLGDGLVPQRGFPAPPSLLDRKQRGFTDGRIFHVITTGQNNVMPSYAGALTPQDRWAVVIYVRALQAAFPAPPPEPPAPPAEPAANPPVKEVAP